VQAFGAGPLSVKIPAMQGISLGGGDGSTLCPNSLRCRLFFGPRKGQGLPFETGKSGALGGADATDKFPVEQGILAATSRNKFPSKQGFSTLRPMPEKQGENRDVGSAQDQGNNNECARDIGAEKQGSYW
jgi:hypothetical protein